MKLNLPDLDRPLRPRPNHLALPTLTIAQPKHSVDTATDRVFDRDVLYWLFDAPDVDVGVEGAGGAVEGIGSPCEGVNPCGVEGPAGGYCLLWRA